MFKNQSLQIQLTIQCAQLNAGDSKGCVGNDQHIVVFFQQYACDVHLLPMASLVPKINESNIFCSTEVSQRCIISLKLLPGSWLFCKLGPGGLVAGPTTNSDTWARYQWQFKAVSKIYIKKTFRIVCHKNDQNTDCGFHVLSHLFDLFLLLCLLVVGGFSFPLLLIFSDAQTSLFSPNSDTNPLTDSLSFDGARVQSCLVTLVSLATMANLLSLLDLKVRLDINVGTKSEDPLCCGSPLP